MQLHNALKEGIIKEAVFLALDNMSDTDTSIVEAKTYLSASLPPGSIVMVTARTKESLTRVRPYLMGENCVEMPELRIEEAKSLFAKSSGFELGNEDDEQLIQRCVQRCWFLKDGDKGYHYHPLALDVLGRQLGYIDLKEWNAQLDKIDEDIFNQSKENNHPVFSIVRKIFDALSPEDQLLFMDVALFLPGITYAQVVSVQFQWLGMVHGLARIEDVMTALSVQSSVLYRCSSQINFEFYVSLFRSSINLCSVVVYCGICNEDSGLIILRSSVVLWRDDFLFDCSYRG